jgi:hypothetical protein
MEGRIEHGFPWFKIGWTAWFSARIFWKTPGIIA